MGFGKVGKLGYRELAAVGLAGDLTFEVVIILMGAFYPALDATAGERERLTLETTLVAPVPRQCPAMAPPRCLCLWVRRPC